MPMTLSGTTGIVQPTAAAPAFSAYAGTTTSFTNSVGTKVVFNTEEYDTANCYATANSRFTPNIAGYYQVSAGNTFATNGTNSRWLYLHKNGSVYKAISWTKGDSTNFSQLYGSCEIYLNGTTDFIEIYSSQNSGSTLSNNAAASDVYFQAAMIRSA